MKRLVAEEREQILSFFSNPENWDFKKIYNFIKKTGISIHSIRNLKRKYNLSIKRTCPNCGIEFDAFRTSQYHCSKKCYWERKHPLKKCIVCNNEFRATIKTQKYCPKHIRHRNLISKICPTCKNEFMTTGKRMVYCSLDCTYPIKRCLNCQKEFRTWGKGKFCSRLCFSVWRKKEWLQNNPPRVCRFCGKKYQPKTRNPNGIYCSMECQINDRIKNAQKRKEERIKRSIINCSECGNKFRKQMINQKYCSTNCRRIAYNKKCLHPCLNCGKETNRPKYCSSMCQVEHYHHYTRKKKCPECRIEFMSSSGRRYCEKCALYRMTNSQHNQILAKNNQTRMFAKFILLLKTIDQEAYEKVYKKFKTQERENNPEWFKGNNAKFRKKIYKWQKILKK